MALERGERNVVEHVLVRRFEDHAWRTAGFPGLDPARHIQAPAVALLQAAEAQIRTICWTESCDITVFQYELSPFPSRGVAARVVRQRTDPNRHESSARVSTPTKY